VNASTIASERGVEVARTTHAPSGDYVHLLEVAVSAGDNEVRVAGTIYGVGELRVVRLSGFPLEFEPEGLLLILRNRDVPGVIGRFGAILGDREINIAAIHLARENDEQAIAVLRLDQPPAEGVLEELLGLPEVHSVDVVGLD